LFAISFFWQSIYLLPIVKSTRLHSLKMILSNRFLALCSIMALASGHPSFKNDSIILLEETIGDVHLVWRGDPNPILATFPQLNSLAPVCGTNDLKCDGSHQADIVACQAVAGALSGSERNNPLPGSPREVCATTTSHGKCCVTWANAASGAIRSNLVNAVIKINNGCMDSGKQKVSGLVRNSYVGSTCTTVCLSDRETRCN
jgi:hypothetical protein